MDEDLEEQVICSNVKYYHNANWRKLEIVDSKISTLKGAKATEFVGLQKGEVLAINRTDPCELTKLNNINEQKVLLKKQISVPHQFQYSSYLLFTKNLKMVIFVDRENNVVGINLNDGTVTMILDKSNALLQEQIDFKHPITIYYASNSHLYFLNGIHLCRVQYGQSTVEEIHNFGYDDEYEKDMNKISNFITFRDKAKIHLDRESNDLFLIYIKPPERTLISIIRINQESGQVINSTTKTIELDPIFSLNYCQSMRKSFLLKLPENTFQLMSVKSLKFGDKYRVGKGNSYFSIDYDEKPAIIYCRRVEYIFIKVIKHPTAGYFSFILLAVIKNNFHEIALRSKTSLVNLGIQRFLYIVDGGCTFLAKLKSKKQDWTEDGVKWLQIKFK